MRNPALLLTLTLAAALVAVPAPAPNVTDWRTQASALSALLAT
jgi:hypothetical protein